jgi:hypothetical protein
MDNKEGNKDMKAKEKKTRKMRKKKTERNTGDEEQTSAQVMIDG